MTLQGALEMSAGPVDADALVADLFEQEGASLVRLARIFCDDRNAAEDLVQEAFIRLHRSASSIRDLDRTPAFLRSIVLNLARDHNRRGMMSLRHQASAEPPRRVEPDPGERAVADDESALVLDALRTLPDRQRACLVLRYYEELPVREVADVLGISVNSVKTHCARGLAALEARLEEVP